MRCYISFFLLVCVGSVHADEKTALGAARNALSDKNYAEALTWANQAVAKDERNAEARYIRATILMELRQFDKAAEDWTRLAAEAFDRRGIAQFKLAKIKESLADFDKQIELNPKAAAAHWRRGLTLYYADEFAKGVAQFTTSDKEEPNDVENAVWHFLCNARVLDLDKARAEILKVAKDPRGEYFMKIYELFRGNSKPDEVFTAAEAGTVKDELRKEQRFYANYYVGMYYESIKEPKKSLEYLKTAVEKYPIGHYMMDVARVHIKLREK